MNERLAQLWLDVRFATRIFAKRPGFTLIAAVTLAIGIGATAGVFSIVEAVLRRPLPYREPDRLAAIWITSTREQGLAKIFATYADYAEFRRHSQTLESVAAATWAKQASRVLTGRGLTRDVLTIPASASFFETLGVGAATGRTFREEDEKLGCSVVLADEFWKSALGGDRSIAGKTLVLDQKPCTVLGVMPARFSFYPRQTEAWILLGPGFDAEQDQMLVGIFARLKRGVTPGQAESELRDLYRSLHPGSDMRDFLPVVYDLHGELTFLAGRTLRITLILVFAAVLLVLLIACLNTANLMLARLSERRREFTVRAALGSGRSRLVRQVLTEGLLLSGLGTGLGVGLAYMAVRYFRVVSPIELSVGADVRLSMPVLVFSAGLSIATTLLFGLLPALRASRVDLSEGLKAAGGRGSVQGRHGLAKTLIGVEMALSFLLLVGAGLLMTSALRMGSEALGFNAERVLAMQVSLPAFRYSSDAQRVRFYDRMLELLERVPGAAAVTIASKLPPNAGGNQVLEIQGRAAASGGGVHEVGADAVAGRYFDVLNIPIRRGRAFSPQDRENTQPVAIVNEALARRYFPDTDPIGQQIRLAGGRMAWLTVVGVAGNVKHVTLMNEMSWVETPIFYRPLVQEPRQSVQAAVRISRDAGSVAREMQRQIAAVDPFLPIRDAEPLTTRLAATLAYPRFRAAVLGFFAVAALVLAAAGLHGVLSQLVIQRVPEFGIRKAVGAQTHDLLLLIGWEGGAPVIGGLVVGLVLTVGLSRFMASLLYGIQAADPRALAGVAVTLLAAAAAAILLPASRAARVDPMTALRDE